MSNLGIDIGGTHIRIGDVDGLTIRNLVSLSTPWERDRFLNILFFYIKKMIHDKTKAVGIGIPGVVDPFAKRIFSCPNIPFLDNFPLSRMIEEEFDLPVFMENDVNAASLAEMETREKKYRNIIVLYIGTGIGGAVIINRKLYQGTWGGAMEIGHMVIDPDGPICVCGNKGCIEAFVSGYALRRMSKEYSGKEMKGEEVFEAFHRGEIWAKQIIEEFISHLEIGMLNIANIFSPDIVIIGGGIKEEIRPFIKDIRKYLIKWGRTYRYNSFPIEISTLKEPGVIGASLLPLHLEGGN